MNRHRFPGLRDGWARLDGAAGTQPVDAAIDAMAEWMRSGRNANHGGAFAAARATDALTERARAAVGRLLGADPEGVAFGSSTTALTFAFSAAVGRTLQPGDEIVCTRLDHDANVAPWLVAAGRAGATVRFADPDRETLDLPAAAVEAVLSERTRWIAVTAASNAVGAIPDLDGIVAAARRVGARVYVDAVHAAPHRPLDLRALGADVLVSSAYKWFGPHQAALCGDPAVLADLHPDKLRPSPDWVPWRWELGTAAFEALAGVEAAAEYLMEVGWDAVAEHEAALLHRMLDGLAGISGVTVLGAPRRRAPTVMFTVAGLNPAQVAGALAAREVAVWHGNYYALELSRFLGLEPDGALRAGVVHYNDAEDVERLVAGVAELAVAEVA